MTLPMRAPKTSSSRSERLLMPCLRVMLWFTSVCVRVGALTPVIRSTLTRALFKAFRSLAAECGLGFLSSSSQHRLIA